MLGLFKKPDKISQLNKRYKTLMKEYYQLSNKDRKAADSKMAEAEAVLNEMDKN